MTITEGLTVRIVARACRHHNATGRVVAVVEGQHHPYAVTGLADWWLWFGDHELEIVHEGVVAA